MPIVLIILDGLGDRPSPRLGHRTPSEAASTPVLDALAARGASGVHLPFGPGRAPSSELAHWALFGYEGVPFCGRAVLEALGHGLDPAEGAVHLYAALRPSQVHDGKVWINGRPTAGDTGDARRLLEVVADRVVQDLRFLLLPLDRGEAILQVGGPASDQVSDSDPFYEDRQPWLRPRGYADAADPDRAAATADALTEYLGWARGALAGHPVNAARRTRRLPALDTLTTKWIGRRRPVPPFVERVGVKGGAVTSSPLYGGLATLLGMEALAVPSLADPATDLSRRLDAARLLLSQGCAFVHVHSKLTDEAGHAKDPDGKMAVIEGIDAGLASLEEPPFDRAIVCITGDHATPSSWGVLHSGDPTPLVVAGPTVRPDESNGFGEASAQKGSLGVLRASEVLPLLLGYANRARFLGARAGPHDTLGLPDETEAMPLG
jgi:2,3-bisphosphoglycerate-independent phosphoglycerate mutase